MKIELSKTEIRALLVSMAIASRKTLGFPYEKYVEKLFKNFQEMLGERCDVESNKWFKKNKPPAKLEWGEWVE